MPQDNRMTGSMFRRGMGQATAQGRLADRINSLVNSYREDRPMAQGYPESPLSPLTQQRVAAIEGGMSSVSPLEQAVIDRTRRTSSAALAGGPAMSGMTGRFGQGSPLTGGYASYEGTSLDEAGRQQRLQQMSEGFRRGQEYLRGQYQAGLAGDRTAQPVSPLQDGTGEFALTSRANAARQRGDHEEAAQYEAQYAASRQRMEQNQAAYRAQNGDRRQRRESDTLRRKLNMQARTLAARGVSPLSATGQSLAPELYQSMQQQRQSLRGQTSSPLSGVSYDPRASRTPEQINNATAEAVQMVSESPMFQQFGIAPPEDVSPGALPSPQSILKGMDNFIANGGELGMEHMEELQGYLLRYSVANPGTDLNVQGVDEEAYGLSALNKLLQARNPEQVQNVLSEFNSRAAKKKAQASAEKISSSPPPYQGYWNDVAMP